MTERPPPARCIATFSGRVQGVFFRDTVLAIAAEHAVAGTVRNAGDGVEIDVEGEPAAIEAFLADVLARPPRDARVDNVERRFASPVGRSTFERARTVRNEPREPRPGAVRRPG